MTTPGPRRSPAEDFKAGLERVVTPAEVRTALLDYVTRLVEEKDAARAAHNHGHPDDRRD